MRLSLVAILVCLATAARADVFNMPSGQTSVQFVTIGDPGNVADLADGDSSTPGIQNFGSVGYFYYMGKYDVTTAQYTQFLNAVAATDTYGLYSAADSQGTSMSTAFPTVGISRSGSSGSYTYSVVGNGNMPVFDVSWGDAARFCNWLQNRQPTGAEGNGTTETGAYTLNGATSQAALMTITRNADAKYFIPSEDEWYKAAYYKAGGTNAGYWTYATQSNSIPSHVLSAVGTNNANYHFGGYTDPVNLLTPVGAFASSPSAYGTFDQAGDVLQWNEATFGNSSRALRGGAYYFVSSLLPSSARSIFYPTSEDPFAGFRVAMVPEPSSFALLAIGAAGLLLWARRRKASA